MKMQQFEGENMKLSRWFIKHMHYIQVSSHLHHHCCHQHRSKRSDFIPDGSMRRLITSVIARMKPII